jgi:hypothetical protein
MCLGTGANRDYLVVGSDSGKISVLEFDQSLNDWKVVHCEIFGKTGCRRIVPGQYLAAGRHCLSLSTPSLLDRITVSVRRPERKGFADCRRGEAKVCVRDEPRLHESADHFFPVG